MFNDFSYIVNTLNNNTKNTINKELFIELVNLTYNLNPDGKGKQRKRTLEELLNIINS